METEEEKETQEETPAKKENKSIFEKTRRVISEMLRIIEAILNGFH